MTETYDIVVIGGGNAALCAAITAAEPIALERLVRSEIARGATETIEIVFPETVAFVLSAAASSAVSTRAGT